MFTRQDYMDKKVSHSDYYGQFVTPAIILCVERTIGKERILAATDKHLNDIPLEEWDRMEWNIRWHCDKAVRAINGTVSLSDCVCIAKAAAYRIRGE